MTDMLFRLAIALAAIPLALCCLVLAFGSFEILSRFRSLRR
jgi:hypothetical protein